MESMVMNEQRCWAFATMRATSRVFTLAVYTTIKYLRSNIARTS